MDRDSSRSGRERGFSLIEVLVALLILGFVALGIASLFSHAQVTNASGYDYAVLASEARRALEALQAMPFADAGLADTGGVPRVWNQTSRGFTVRYTVDDYQLINWGQVNAGNWPPPGAGNTGNVKRITVRVSSDSLYLVGSRQFVVSALKIPG